MKKAAEIEFFTTKDVLEITGINSNTLQDLQRGEPLIGPALRSVEHSVEKVKRGKGKKYTRRDLIFINLYQSTYKLGLIQKSLYPKIYKASYVFDEFTPPSSNIFLLEFEYETSESRLSKRLKRDLSKEAISYLKEVKKSTSFQLDYILEISVIDGEISIDINAIERAILSDSGFREITIYKSQQSNFIRDCDALVKVNLGRLTNKIDKYMR